MTLRHAFGLFQAAKLRENLRPLTMRNLESRLASLLRAHGSRELGAVTEQDLTTLIFRPKSGPVNQNGDIRAYTCLFNWLVNQGHLAANPMRRVPRPKVDRGEPVILTLAQCRKLLFETLWVHSHLTPYVVLGLFCGIRPYELRRLTWDQVDIEEQTVTITAQMAKLRARRIVTISDNALMFLLAHAPKRTPFFPINWRRQFDKLKYAAGLESWTVDILRHTAISMHLAEHEHEGRTAMWSGNSPDIIQRHYKGLVKKREATEFWQISPKTLDNIDEKQYAKTA